MIPFLMLMDRLVQNKNNQKVLNAFSREDNKVMLALLITIGRLTFHASIRNNY